MRHSFTCGDRSLNIAVTAMFNGSSAVVDHRHLQPPAEGGIITVADVQLSNCNCRATFKREASQNNVPGRVASAQGNRGCTDTV
jgi:hypothetical protein